MRREILIQNEHHEVTVTDRLGDRWMNVGEAAAEMIALVDTRSGQATIRLGDRTEPIEMAVKGETVFIKAFDRNFTLQIVDPVEQAAQVSGGQSNSARAPMPGVVVDIQVEAGDKVNKGQALMTIESMKILTVIKAPRDGSVEQIHVRVGQTFDKNAELVSLIKIEES